MKVILLQKIRNLGDLGSVVQVKAGYGRNYLIPEGRAIRATKENLAKFEVQRAELEKKAFEVLSMAEKRAEQLKDFSVTMKRQVIEEGKLFGSVSVRDIAEALENAGVEVDKREINLPYGAIKEVGEYEVELQLHSDIVVPIKVIVEAEK